jgi:hypothetical protein
LRELIDQKEQSNGVEEIQVQRFSATFVSESSGEDWAHSLSPEHGCVLRGRRQHNSICGFGNDSLRRG